ncbi:MAG: metal ABC transporter substrate-binding protein [Planctomycetota bacterium]
MRNRMIAPITLFLALCFVSAARLPAQKLQVVTTQPDLADVVRAIGGDLVEVRSLTSGREDLHLVTIRPSTLGAVRKADVFVQLGLDAEHQWVPAMLGAVRNRKLRPGEAGFINASEDIDPIFTTPGRSRAEGADIHPRGNPHWNLDPGRMRIAAHTIRDALIKLRPAERKALEKNCALWEEKLDAAMKRWEKALAPCKGRTFIEEHDAWIYFAKRFGLEIAGRMEPKPGLNPTPKHLESLVETARDRKVRLIVTRPARGELGRDLAAKCKARSAVIDLSSHEIDEPEGYLVFMEKVVNAFATGFGDDSK